jgi:hypothetical protein
MSTADTTAPAAPLPSPAAALCQPSTWPLLAPALLQRRLPLDAGPDLVHQWLSDGMARVGAPARDALRLIACQTWRLQALPPDHQQHAGVRLQLAYQGPELVAAMRIEQHQHAYAMWLHAAHHIPEQRQLGTWHDIDRHRQVQLRGIHAKRNGGQRERGHVSLGAARGHSVRHGAAKQRVGAVRKVRVVRLGGPPGEQHHGPLARTDLRPRHVCKGPRCGRVMCGISHAAS